MIILRQREFSEAGKRKDRESGTPIYDRYLHNLTPGQAKVVREEDKDRKKLNLRPYIEKAEKEHGYKYGSLKRPIDYEDEEKTVEDFKRSNSLKNKVTGGGLGGSLGFLGGVLAGSLKTKNADKSVLLGLAGAGVGTAAGVLAGKKIGEKKDEKLIREALKERNRESDIKFKKKKKK